MSRVYNVIKTPAITGSFCALNDIVIKEAVISIHFDFVTVELPESQAKVLLKMLKDILHEGE